MKLSTIRRLASEVIGCGQRKVWLDPNEHLRITNATTRQKVTQLISDNLIVRKPDAVHSRYHTLKRQYEVSLGRHRGPGKVRGCKNAIVSTRRQWITKIRELRNTLKTMRENKYISPSGHKTLSLQAKGNLFKNNKALVEFVEKKKVDEKRMRDLSEQASALRMAKENEMRE